MHFCFRLIGDIKRNAQSKTEYKYFHFRLHWSARRASVVNAAVVLALLSVVLVSFVILMPYQRPTIDAHNNKNNNKNTTLSTLNKLYLVIHSHKANSCRGKVRG